MTISFVAASTGNSSPYGTSMSLAKPSGVANGDVMIAIIGGNPSTLSGWTKIGASTTPPNSSGGPMGVFYKKASSEGSSYSWTVSGSYFCCGTIVAYRGCDPTTPVDTAHTSIAVDSGSDYTTGAVTASGTQWGVAFAHEYSYGAGSTSWTTSTATSRTSNHYTSGSEECSYFVCDSNANLSAGSHTEALTANHSTDGGARGLILLNDSGVSVDLGSDGVASDNHATAWQTTVLIQTVQAASASILGHNTSVGFEVNADEAAEPSVVAHDATRPIFPADAEVDAEAEEASVHLDVNVRHANADATAFDASGYYGAATVRVYVVPDENRTYKVER